MKLTGLIESSRRYRLSLNTGWGPIQIEVAPTPQGRPKGSGPRTRHAATDKGFLPNARFFECDDEAQVLVFWQEGKGVALELCAYAPYSALLALEPLD
ncbi:MAG: hypothetical protein HY814_03050 [Candidatus Riflebacteria bacterium]|nr:hypothetical protein [Candidatus Riflebacteria bacterium]